MIKSYAAGINHGAMSVVVIKYDYNNDAFEMIDNQRYFENMNFWVRTASWWLSIFNSSSPGQNGLHFADDI